MPYEELSATAIAPLCLTPAHAIQAHSMTWTMFDHSRARATAKTAAKAPVVNWRGTVSAKLLGEAVADVVEVPDAAEAAAEVAEEAAAEPEEAAEELPASVAFRLPHFRASLQAFCF